MGQRLKWHLSLTGVCFLLGWLLTVQYRSLHPSGSSHGDDVTQVTHQLEVVRTQNKTLESKINDLQKKIDDMEKQFGGDLSSFEQMREELDRMRILAGAPVTGPGISVTVDDGKPGSAATSGHKAVVQEWDILRLVNELLASGAEAVSVNGQRWAMVSAAPSDAAPVHLHAPYQIQAVGDPAVLITALSMRGGVLDWLQQRGLTVSSPKPVNTLHLAGYDGRRWTFDIRQ
ncbi:MAG: DUF881 domain-containing protein [Alicyclobacillaceae bacterium]|nr:DUF881 domain-containing protein [Alicyclobacillaceae bacterium]